MNQDDLRRAIEESGAEWEVAEEPVEAESMLGYLPSEGVPPIEEQEQLAASMAEEALGAARPPTYPPKHDWRNVRGRRYITPVRDQADCGSCVSFAACATVEGTLAVEKQLQIDLSEAYLFYCVAAKQGRRCGGEMGGWYPKKALEAIKDGGVPDEACFPYRPGDQRCAVINNWQRRAVKIAEWTPLHRPAEMKQWIAKRGPVMGSMQVYEDFQIYAGGIYKYAAGDALGGHAISVVGYNEPERYWVIKNSWGPDWGESGFCRIGYGQVGIDSGMLGARGVILPRAAYREQAGAVPMEA
jgi:C1A family cysteine protease